MEFETSLGYMKLCRPIFTKIKEINKQETKESDMTGQHIYYPCTLEAEAGGLSA